MIKKEKAKIYSQYEIDVLLFYITMTLFLPVVLVFSYLFQIEQILNINTFIFWLLIVNLVSILVGTIILVLKKDKLRRRVKASYRYGFFYLISLFCFGLLGFVVIFDYMGGNRAYVANILVFLFALLLATVIHLGKKYFKFDLMKRK